MSISGPKMGKHDDCAEILLFLKDVGLIKDGQ